MPPKRRKKIPTIILDIDDTVVDFTGFLCYLFNSINNTSITEADLVSWHFNKAKVEDIRGNVVKGTELRKFFHNYEAHGLYSATPPIKESILAMTLMKKLGYKIILLTARSEDFKKDTQISMIMHSIPHDEIVFDADKPKQINRLARKHNIVAFADDKYDHVKSVFETDKVDTCYIINKSHNKEKELPEEIVRINDLLEMPRNLPDVTKNGG